MELYREIHESASDLSGNQNGTASFTNKKSGDGLLTDTDYVRNIVIPEK